VAQHELASFGQPERPAARQALEHPCPDDALERADLLADRRLRVAEPGGCRSEGALVGDRLQSREMTDLEPSQRSASMNGS
jgi:hypothetical protein